MNNWNTMFNNISDFADKYRNKSREFWSNYPSLSFDLPSYAMKLVPKFADLGKFFNINNSPTYDVPSYAQKVNLSPEYNMPSYAKSPVPSKVSVRVARPQSQESFVSPSPQYDMPSYARSETYQYNPKTTQASREGYQQYVDAVNAWDNQKATPEQQYVNNFINSFDQYQRIRNGWR